MSDIPDFDNMTPEEMARWMESLAKRQGADPESLTTDADMEIEEINADDDRLRDAGDYIPQGWTKEKWEAQLAKEAAERAAKQSSAPQKPATPAASPPPATPEPTPQPTPQPVTQAPASYTPEPIAADDDTSDAAGEMAGGMADGMPDFDSMTPDEINRWMESLAKRQGADPESLVTDADMEIEEIDADDDRLRDAGDYIPQGWTQEKWEAQLAKEAAERAAKQGRAPQPMAEEDDEIEYADDTGPVYAVDDEEPIVFDEEAVIDLDSEDYDEDEFELEYADEDEDYAYAALSEDADEDDEDFAGWQQPAASASASASPEDWLRSLTGTAEPSAAYEEDEEEARGWQQPEPAMAAPEIEDLDAYDDDYDDTVYEPTGGPDDPLDWLQSLSGGEDEAAGLDVSALENLSVSDEAGAGSDPMGWLSQLAEETRGDTLPDLSDLGQINDDLAGLGALISSEEPLGAVIDDDEEDVDPLNWMESIARDMGAPTDELTTEADLEIDEPTQAETEGPGYEPYSFEMGGRPEPDELEELADLPELVDYEPYTQADPSEWLDAIAASHGARQAAEPAAELSEEESADAAEDAAVAAEASSTIKRLDAGESVSPEQIDDFFQEMFRQAEQRQYVDEEDFEEETFADEDLLPEEALEANIPEWLREQMDAAQNDQVMTPEEANAILEAQFGVDLAAEEADEEADEEEFEFFTADELAEEAEEEDTDGMQPLPDWLQVDLDEEPAADFSDIFDEEAEAEPEETSTPAETMAISAPPAASPVLVNADDNWVQAFAIESDPNKRDELAEWYASRRSTYVTSEVETVQPLASAELPIERELSLGEAELVPDWMGGSVRATSEQPFLAPGIPEPVMPDLAADEDGGDEGDAMPDWLLPEVSDDQDVPLPSWLEVEQDVDVEDIPDWLLDTIEDDEPALPALDQPIIPATPTPAPKPAPSVPASPAPVPTSAQIDVPVALQSARQKAREGDVEGCLSDYEAIIRANSALNEVVDDLQALATKPQQQRNPAVLRVLGDGMMRQGRLQDALETYRKALKLL